MYLRLRTDTASPPHLSYITWYQVIPICATPTNIAPSGTFSSATSVSVPRDYKGYYLDYQSY